ncbi:hypothetical protein HK097_010671 [Rhizophlyctis rosea]|uniref:polynucleotide adenylyltransferase n=1 Tax=Rhizophlyctis rosea TaxID=64517 RepID=A0AAD5X8S3_9FUNG|nr:hypothetical protein HK097_010671 [Rhizophlyctis rosea]
MHMQSVQERAEAQSQHEQAQYTRGHQRIASELDKGYIMERDSEEVTTAYGLLPHGLFIGTPEPSASAADYVGRENGGVQSAAGVVRSDADMSAAVLNGSEAQYDPSIPVAEELLKSKLRSDPARLNRRYFDALSKSILEVVQQVRMGGGKSGRWEQERERLGGVVKTVRMIIESVFPGSTVHQVGSTVSGLALADADLDFTVLFPRGTNYTAVQCVERLAGALKLDGPFGEVKPLPRAKVPILKLKDMATGIRCDISFGNELALHNTKLLATYALLDHRVRQMTVFRELPSISLHPPESDLVTSVKHWVKRKGINFPVMGHPSSYCYTLLVINFLQRRNVIPSLQTLPPSGSGTVPERLLTTSSGSYNVYFHNEPDRLHEIWQTENEETVGELLLAFFKDFGTELDFVYKVSSVRTGGLLHKAEKNWSKDSANGRSGGGRIKHWMAVEDPFDLEQNLSSSVDRDMLHAIRGHFQVASKILCGATDLPASKSLGLETMGTAALARAVVEKICEECEPLKRGGVSGRSAAAFGGGVGRRGRKSKGIYLGE